MSKFDFELVGKIGSMALINKADNDIDYNVFARIGSCLRPGMIWVSSGATEIGRIDHKHRNNNRELLGDLEDIKADYAAQGQMILMQNYRRFVPYEYSLRQLLVEHTHFNDEVKKEHIRRFLMRCSVQNAIPIVNYNDPVSDAENRHCELNDLMELHGEDNVVECIDNDETAAVISQLVHSKYLVILTSVQGIYADHTDPSTLIEEISGKDTYEVVENIRNCQKSCVGASRQGANGAGAKLEFSIEPVKQGTTVIIASAKYNLYDIILGKCKRTVIGVR